MIIMFTMSVIGLSLAQTVLMQYGTTKQQLYAENAVAAAEAGISATLARLNTDPNYSGYSTEQNLYSDPQRGKATYSTTITQSGDNRTITSTGRAYKTTDNSQLAKTRAIRVVAVINRDEIANSLIIGSGGVYMSQNSGLPSGDIYIRGQAQMERYSFMGSTTTSVNLNIANVGCGTSNWPQPCGTSSPPIRMLNSITGSIYGTVCAKDQPNPTAGIYTGPSGTGLTDGCEPRVSAAPTFNKKAFVQSVSTTPTNPNNFVCDFWNPTRTIPAGTRVSGNLTIPAGCTLYIAGDVFITGNFVINAGAVVRVADSVGSIRPTVVVNQGIGFYANGGMNNIILRNNVGTPMFIIAFGSTNTTCSANENIPSDTVHTCLTPTEARLSAAPAAFGGGTSLTANFTGAILYLYYGSLSFSANAIAQFYAFGAQGAWLGAGTQFTTIAEDAPFGNILSFPNYQVADYQQLY